jgi:hypothetical protein
MLVYRIVFFVNLESNKPIKYLDLQGGPDIAHMQDLLERLSVGKLRDLTGNQRGKTNLPR